MDMVVSPPLTLAISNNGPLFWPKRKTGTVNTSSPGAPNPFGPGVGANGPPPAGCACAAAGANVRPAMQIRNVATAWDSNFDELVFIRYLRRQAVTRPRGGGNFVAYDLSTARVAAGRRRLRRPRMFSSSTANDKAMAK